MNDLSERAVPDGGAGIDAAPGQALKLSSQEQDGTVESPPLSSGQIYNVPPTLENLRPGEEWIVQLRRNQLGPNFPLRPGVYRYFRAGNRLFRSLVEEVT